MSARSRSSGVQGLRAMFEQNNETTSPPSRGRSPAGSVTSDGARPYSKVRTSFIPVERSGQSPRKMSISEGIIEGQGQQAGLDQSSGASGEGAKQKGAASPKSTEDRSPEKNTNIDTELPQEAEIKPAKSSGENESLPVDTPSRNPDKPVSGAKEAPVNMLSRDPKEEKAITGGSALKTNGPDLGSVLKGSPFGEAKAKSHDAVETPNPKKDDVSIADETPSKAPKSPGIAKVNGQPKGTRKSGEGSKNTSLKSPKPQQTDGPTDSLTTDKVKQAYPKTKHPNGLIDSATKDKAQKATTAKASAVEPAKTRQSIRTSTGPSTKTSPKSAVTKPRPKSPTRPVRLPSSATAPTASSAAKLGALSRSPSRASATSSQKPVNSTQNRRAPLNSTTAQSRQKPARTSLPQKSDATQKPKPRTSTASTKASDGGFLARMMRPTESSKSKTHEKVEVKSPPRKAVRPKRKSGVSESSESDKKEAVPASNNDPVEAQEQEQPASKSEDTAKEGVAEGATEVSAS